MKDFFRHNGLLLIIIAALLSILIGIASLFLGSNPFANLFNVVTAPVRGGISSASNLVGGVYQYVLHYGEISTELDDLRKQVGELEAKVRENEEAARENVQLRELLGLQAKRRDFVFESARVTRRSTSNWESTLTLAKGTAAGIQTGNCVVTESGVLVGVVSETGVNWSTVSTVINTDIEMGGLVSRTNCSGILEGDFALMNQNRLKLSYLTQGAQLVAGDEVLTSGKGDVYPSGLVVGRVESVLTDPSGMSRYAVVIPDVTVDALTEVFVIKSFDIIE